MCDSSFTYTSKDKIERTSLFTAHFVKITLHCAFLFHRTDAEVFLWNSTIVALHYSAIRFTTIHLWTEKVTSVHCFLRLYWEHCKQCKRWENILTFIYTWFDSKQGQIILCHKIPVWSSHAASLVLSTSSPHSPVTFPKNQVFVRFLLPNVLLICLWFFTSPPTHVLLTYLWFGSEIDIGWNDTHLTALENKAKNWRASEKRGGQMKVKALWPCKSALSQFQVVICSLKTLNYSSLAKTSPESFAFLGRIKLSAVSGSSAPACLL